MSRNTVPDQELVAKEAVTPTHDFIISALEFALRVPWPILLHCVKINTMFVSQLCLDIISDLQLCWSVVVPSREKLTLFEALNFELSGAVNYSIFVLRHNSVNLLKWQRVLIDMIPEGITAASWHLGSFQILLLK